MSKQERIGIYGGTFDPIHKTHLDIARAALLHAQLDRILFVVAASPPHKQQGINTPAELRLEMVQAAIVDEPRFQTSRVELDREGPSYMADTVRLLHEQKPGAAFFLIIGEDMLVDFPSWREPDTVLRYVRLLAVHRPGITQSIPSQLEGKYELLPFSESTCSSTTIRRGIENDQDMRALLPDGVAQIIAERGLYHGN